MSKYKVIDYFMTLVAGSQAKHAQFASIAIGNLARNPIFREHIRRSGGIQTLVGCVMSAEYQRRRYACLALANMALSMGTGTFSSDLHMKFAVFNHFLLIYI